MMTFTVHNCKKRSSLKTAGGACVLLEVAIVGGLICLALLDEYCELGTGHSGSLVPGVTKVKQDCISLHMINC